MASVVVIGAGFSGLVCAWSLQRDGFDVTVVEASSRSGGLIQSIENRLGLVETAANGLLSSELVEELFLDCGVQIQETKKSARRRYIAVDSEVTRFPLSFFETLAVIPRLFRVKKKAPRPFETLQSWGSRALGDAITEKILAVATLGIYAAQASDLSANLLLGRFYDSRRLRNRPGRIKGTVSANKGLEAILKSLRDCLNARGVKFVFNSGSGADFLKREENSVVVIATSAWNAFELLSAARPGDPRVDALAQVESVPLVSLTLFFKKSPARLGFGTLFSQSTSLGESDGILGCLQNSEIFEHRSAPGVHSETWILGGVTHGEEILAQSDSELVSRVLEKRRRWIDSNSEENLLKSVVTRWPRAIPHYSTDLERLIPILKSDQDGVILFGNYFGDLGLASILESTRLLKSRVLR